MSAAAGRRYKQKVHTLYMPIYLHRKVYTPYIRIEPQIPGKYCIQIVSRHFCRQEHPEEHKEYQVHQVIYIRQAEPGLKGNFKKAEVTEMVEVYRCTILTGKS